MGWRVGWSRVALALALLVGLCGVATPVAAAAIPGGVVPSAGTSPFEAPDLVLSDLLHARPVAAVAEPGESAPPVAVLFCVAALVFLGLRSREQAPRTIARPAVPRRGRSPPTVPN